MNDHIKKAEYVVNASVSEASDTELENIRKSSFFSSQAAAPTMDGKPRMLHITAWMVHEGRNHNGDAFIKEELQEKVKEGLFTPPHGGMIDFDHDFMPIGFWYDASFSFDSKANAWGIIVKGAIWAWRFPEVANKLIADQVREGNIPVSMSVVSESLEFVKDFPGAEELQTVILHNPVFLTTSLLSVPPADPNARAAVTEDNDNLPATPAKKVADGTNSPEPSGQVPSKEKKKMDNELLNSLQDKLVVATEEKVQAQAETEVAEGTITKLTADLSTAGEEVKTLTEENSRLKTKVAELEVAISSAAEVKEATEKELEELRGKVASFEEQVAVNKKKERLESRLAELPEAVRNNLESHEEKELLLAAWTEAEDEHWETIKKSFSLASKSNKDGFVNRSNRSGNMPTGASADAGSTLSNFIR